MSYKERTKHPKNTRRREEAEEKMGTEWTQDLAKLKKRFATQGYIPKEEEVGI